LTGADVDTLVRVVRAHKTELTQLAEARFLRGFFDECRVDAQFAPVFRRITLGQRELAPLASHLRPAFAPAKLELKGTA
jgi:hypothetical protein